MRYFAVAVNVAFYTLDALREFRKDCAERDCVSGQVNSTTVAIAALLQAPVLVVNPYSQTSTR